MKKLVIIEGATYTSLSCQYYVNSKGTPPPPPPPTEINPAMFTLSLVYPQCMRAEKGEYLHSL